MSDQPNWPTEDEGANRPPPPQAGTPPPPPPPSQGTPSFPGQAGQQPYAPSGNQPQAASYGVRFGARFVDGLVLLIPNLIVSLVVGGSGAAFTGGASLGRAWIAGVVTTLITFGYFVWLEMNQGATLGKKWLNLRVYGAAGGNPTQDEAVKRNAWTLLALVPFIGGLAQLVAAIAIPVTGSSDPYKRGWHDNFAGGTTVVKTS